MPVTIRPQPEKVGSNTDPIARSSQELFRQISKQWIIELGEDDILGDTILSNKKIGLDDRPIVHSSLADLDQPGEHALIPYGNGFVGGILRAFQQDLHLVLRPDDVWLAILGQFSFFVNGNSEALRSSIVRHEGKETINIVTPSSSLGELDLDWISERIVSKMKGFLADEEIVEWLLPRFSTSTMQDKTVAAMTLMATMKSYFEYKVTLGCGFPSVTLEGTKEDWEDISKRVQRFAQYGKETGLWSTYLSKVLDKMIAGFDRPDDQDIKDFWMQACHSTGYEGSGDIESLSGWITAFCFWDENGMIEIYSDRHLAMLPSKIDHKRLMLDDISFPIIRRSDIPRSVSDVPVVIDDLDSGLTYYTTLISGLLGMEGTKADNTFDSGFTQFQPRSGWWMVMDKMEPMISVDPTVPAILFASSSVPLMNGMCTL
ncbi:unnamed protein product [Clonostachys rosea]|uniref:Heterokaryon incompatibility domain-containing protein n=1 Tax=Bionectria ochroleuca TaxID=29856 RepID=A0ABY6UAY3_BIOOC|nr:unnamed protein product [Clonostachys rosea]